MEEKEDPLCTLQDALGFVKESVEDFKSKLKKYRVDWESLVDEKGKTLLIQLIETLTNTDHIWILLEYFADPNVKDQEMGRTALHYACKLNNRGMILALLLFGANPEIHDNEEKKAFELSNISIEEFEQIMEKINKYKIHFVQLTRKRRKHLKYIFDAIDLGTKSIDENKLAG
jgi:hypothetical protein